MLFPPTCSVHVAFLNPTFLLSQCSAPLFNPPCKLYFVKVATASLLEEFVYFYHE